MLQRHWITSVVVVALGSSCVSYVMGQGITGSYRTDDSEDYQVYYYSPYSVNERGGTEFNPYPTYPGLRGSYYSQYDPSARYRSSNWQAAIPGYLSGTGYFNSNYVTRSSFGGVRPVEYANPYQPVPTRKYNFWY